MADYPHTYKTQTLRLYPEQAGLAGATNCLAGEGALVAQKTYTAPTTETVTWPFPQLLSVNGSLVRGLATGLTTVAGVSLPLYGATAPSVAFTPASGGLWEVASVTDSVVYTNGKSLLIGGSGCNSKVLGSNAIYCNTVLNANGLLLLGGFGGTYLSDSGFLSYFSHWKDYAPEGTAVSYSQTFGSNWVVAVLPGLDRQYPISTLRALLGLVTSAEVTSLDPHLKQQLQLGGIKLIEFPGVVYSIRLYQGAPLVFTSVGVYDLNGVKRFDSCVEARSLVAGSQTKLFCFVKLFTEVLGDIRGFKEFLPSCTGVIYDELEDVCYFYNSTYSLALTKFGATQVAACPTSVVGSSAWVTPSGAFTEVLLPKTQFNSRALSQLTYAELVGDGLPIATVTPYVSAEGTYLTLPTRYTSRLGVAYIGGLCNSFYLKVKLAALTGTQRLEAIRVRAANADNRSTHGPRGTFNEELRSSEA